MKKYFKSLICTLLVCSILLGCVGCVNTAGQAEGYLELLDSPTTTLNNVWYNTGGIFRCAVFDTLISTDADMKTFKAALAEKFASSDNGLAYSFTLRDDVAWHDGEILDCDDVLFSLKSLLRSKEVNGLLSSAFQYIEGAQAYASGEADEISGFSVDGNTIRITLTSPIGDFLSAVAQFAILPQHILGDVDPQILEENDYWQKPVGCGPYKVTDAVADEYFILEKNTAYYGDAAGVEKIRLKVSMEDPISAMENGELDFYVTNDPEEIAKLNGMENCSSHRLNVLFPAYLIFNLSNDDGVMEALKDVRVRKALLLAIDRETVVEAIFPSSTVSDTMIPSWDSWYLESGEDFSFDPDKAKELLEEAGFDFSQTIRLRYFTKGKSTEDLMNVIAVYWRAIGINVDLQKFDGSGSQHMFEIRDYDVCYKRLSAFNHAAVYDEMAGSGIIQTSIYNMPVYDDLINSLATTSNDDLKKELLYDMQELDQEHLLRLPLFSLVNIAYVNDNRFDMPEVYGNLWYRYDLSFEDWRLIG